MGRVDAPTDGLRQLERAARLLDIARQGVRRTPVHKSLEQLFGEARNRSQPGGTLGASPFSTTAGVSSRLLQGPRAQLLDQEVANFSLGPSVGASAGVRPAEAAGSTSLGGPSLPEADRADQPNVSLRDFFGLRHEQVLLGAVEEAHRDCMRSLQRHSFDRIQADWEETKQNIMGMIAPHQRGERGGVVGVGSERSAVDPGAPAAVAPPQDTVIIRMMLAESMSQQLVFRIASLSCESCPRYQSELLECWNIVRCCLDPSPRTICCGALKYLQDKFADDVRAAVYRSNDARLGGRPDAWSLVCAYGRMKFETANFPSHASHVWYAAFVAARCGFVDLLLELPDRAAPCSNQCPTLRTVCVLMKDRLQATSTSGQLLDLSAGGDADPADLLRADLAEDSNGFHDVLLSLLLGRRFAFGKLWEGTVQDWLWYRLHATLLAAGDSEQQNPVFSQHLGALRQHVINLPPSHYDPMYGGQQGPAAGGQQNPLMGLDDNAFRSPLGEVERAGASGFAVAQTLNCAKVLLLTGQFKQAVEQLRSQDRCLHGPALHIALVLQRAGSLAAVQSELAGSVGQGSSATSPALTGPAAPLNITGLVCEYARQFGCETQLQYLRVLDLPDRLEALKRLLLSGGMGTNDQLLGYIDAHGRHTPGLLEQTLQEDGSGGGAEFIELCTRAGHEACEHGQYREALRLFHLGRCYTEVLHVLRKCLSLPIWNDPATAASAEASLLAQDIQRFFSIYERNLDRYALSSQAWGVARKLYAARMFHNYCGQGQPLAALDVFDSEQLLPLSGEPPRGVEMDSEIFAEYPRIVDDYVRILRHAASHSVVTTAALHTRVRQLQAFLAVHLHHIVLQQETITALSNLALC